MAKPASGASLDTGHALYTNLAHVWGLLEGGSSATSADSKGTKTLTLSSTGLWATNGSGEAIIRITAATASPLALASALNLPNNADWSIAFRAKQAASDTNGVLLGDNTNTNDFIWMNGGSYMRFRSGVASDSDFSGVTLFTTTANYLMVFDDSDSKVYLYKNGTEINSGGIANDGAINITTLGNGYTTNALALVGDIEYVYVWTGRALSSSDAADLHANPYVIFSGVDPTPSVTIAEPVAWQINQRDGDDVADIKLEGTYGGSPVSLEADWGGDGYNVVTSVPTAGTFTAAKRRRPRGSGTLTMRHSDDHGITDTAGPILVGDVYLVIGQSNAAGRGTNNQTYTGTANWFAKFNVSDLWAQGLDPVGTDGSAAGSWIPLLANRIVTDGSTAVGFVNRAVGGTAISEWLPGQGNYIAAIAAAQAAGRNLKAALWMQGETDAANGVTQATYFGRLKTLAQGIWDDLGVPLIPATIGSNTTGAGPINLAIVQGWAELPYCWPGPTLPTYNADPHWTSDAKLLAVADAWYDDSLEALFYTGSAGGGLLQGGGMAGGFQRS